MLLLPFMPFTNSGFSSILLFGHTYKCALLPHSYLSYHITPSFDKAHDDHLQAPQGLTELQPRATACCGWSCDCRGPRAVESQHFYGQRRDLLWQDRGITQDNLPYREQGNPAGIWGCRLDLPQCKAGLGRVTAPRGRI